MNNPRKGIGFVELLAAIVMLGVLISFVVQMMAVAAQQRRFLESDRAACESVANVMERAMALPYDQVTTSALEDLAQSQPQPSNSQWIMEVEPAQGLPSGKRITIALRNVSLRGRDSTPARLVAWKYDNRTDSSGGTIEPSNDDS